MSNCRLPVIELQLAVGQIDEAYLAESTPEDNIDSLATWQAADGSTWLIASAPGQFRRPNGVFVIDDLLWVVEGDNLRVQVLRLPAFTPLGSFGQDELSKPYGVWLHRARDGFEVLVSDAYMSMSDDDLPPPLEQLDKRYKRYRVSLQGDTLSAQWLGDVGQTDAAGAIRIPGSLWGDEARQRLLLAEEDQADGTRIKVYDFDFRYTGQDLGRGLFKAQAEGVALWQCAVGSGCWLTTDQFKDRSLFHVFDRQSLAHLGSFAGKTVANTDGVWLQQAPTRAFPAGVFYAVHDDQGVGAFDWRQIAAALPLRAARAAADR